LLKALGAAGTSATVYSSGVVAREKTPRPTTSVIHEKEEFDGLRRREYVQQALRSYRGSSLQKRVKSRGYRVNRQDSLVFVGRSGTEESVYVYFTLADGGSDIGSNVFPGLTEGETDAAAIDYGHYIWSSDEQGSGYVLRVDDATSVVPESHSKQISSPDASATELIGDSRHLIDTVGEVEPGESTALSGTESVESTETVVEHVSIDLDSDEVTRDTDTVSAGASEDVGALDTGCPSSFTSTLTSLIGCAGGCTVCIGLLAEPATTIVTCAACGGCSLVTLCCVGSLAPESYCSTFASLRYTTDPAQALAAQVMYDGCRGKACVPTFG
jgi:hypothetical protein